MSMRKVTIMMSMLLALGLSSACSSNDDLTILIDEKLSLFEDSLQSDSLQSIPDEDYTGTLYYDSNYGWTIVPSGVYYDYPSVYYFPLNLPDEFKTNMGESAEVSYTGKVIKMSEEEIESSNLWRYDGKEHFFFVYLTTIEKKEIPYRGNPPFTVTDVQGTVYRDAQGEWYILCSLPNIVYCNAYYPIEMSDDFKDPEGYMNVIISGNVYEEYTDRSWGITKAYKIELTKIEKIK